MFIGISGLIGVGKSTLTQSLADHLGYKTYFEPVEDNPYLEDFYQDMSRWTFPMQMFLMAHRYQQHQECVWDPCHQRGGGVVQDRTIYEDTIFARMHYDDGLMDERDYATYIGHFNIMRRFLQYPDIYVYLRTEPEVAHARIASRSRDCESTIPLEYLLALHAGYERFIEEMKRYTVVVELDWSSFIPTDEVARRVQAAADNNRDFLKSIRRV